MKKLIMAFIALFMMSVSAWGAEVEDSNGSLFINLSTDASHKSMMAVHMSSMMKKGGHPVTIFMNDKAVLLVSKTHKEYAEVQSMIKDLIKLGGSIIVCPMCMKDYAVEGTDLIEGAQVASHEKVEAALFAPNTRTLSW